MAIDLKSKFLGGMVGSALGDAIGELAFSYGDESMLRAVVTRTRPLVYTDDTAMAMGLAASIARCGRIDEQHLGDAFRANYQREPWRGYASGPPMVFSLVERLGLSYSEAARSLFSGQGSYGNGAAMRIVPVGLFFHRARDLYAQARRSAGVTHAHSIGVDGAAVLAWAIARAVRLDPQEPFPLPDVTRGLVRFAQTEEMRTKMELVERLLAQEISPWKAAAHLGRSVAAHESVPFAIYAFLRHPRSFAECLFCAVLNGGDRDTVGAMACAISGAYLGVEAIPADWRERIERRQELEGLALDLWERHRFDRNDQVWYFSGNETFVS